MTYQDIDIDEGMSADERDEYDRDIEFLLDAQDEARDIEEQHKTEAETQTGPEADGECHAEFIDGSYTNCGCEECADRGAADRETYAADFGGEVF